jgi:hypothetical protein
MKMYSNIKNRVTPLEIALLLALVVLMFVNAAFAQTPYSEDPGLISIKRYSLTSEI